MVHPANRRIITEEAINYKIADMTAVRWAPNTFYAAGQQVVNPSGDIVSAKIAFTSAGTYLASNWTLSTTFVPRWAPLTAYTSGQQVVSPGNDVVSANTTHTSAAAYTTDVTKWTQSSTYLPRGRTVTVALPGTAGDAALITNALDTMRVSGKVDGTLVLSGTLSEAVVIDLGFTDTTPGDANWATASTQRARIIGDITLGSALGAALTVEGGYGCDIDLGLRGTGLGGEVADGAITSGQKTLTSPLAVAAGVKAGAVVMVYGAGDSPAGIIQPLAASVRSVAGNVLTLSLNAGATVAAARVVYHDVGLRVENHVGLRLNIFAKNYGGCVLAADATDDSTKRLRTQRAGAISVTACGRGIFMRRIEAFGSLGDIWSTTVYGDYFGQCDDLGWNKYEGGIGGAGGTNIADRYLWLDRPNNANIGSISLGDRATEANLVITGPADFGAIQQLRSSGYGVASSPAAVKMIGVDNGYIGALIEKNCTHGLHIIGGKGTIPSGGISIGTHLSSTGTNTPLYCEPDNTGALAPVTIEMVSYRSCLDQAVIIAVGVTVPTRVKIAGQISQPNTSNGAVYAIDCLSAAVLLDVAGLWQRLRTGSILGGINHANPDNLRGVAYARIENQTVHGALPVLWAGTAISTQQQNLSDRTLVFYVLARLQPTVGATAQVETFIGPTSSLFNTGAQYLKYDPTASVPNDEIRLVIFEVPPWWWFKMTVTTGSINRTASMYR